MAYQAFQDNLLQFFQIEEADPVEKEKFLKLLEELSSQVTLDCILQKLDSTDSTTFLDLLQQDTSGQKAIEFAQQKIPMLNDIVTKKMQEEIAALRTANQ